jgi:hypothetical protein
MKKFLLSIILFIPIDSYANEVKIPSTETIVLFRHAEKPAQEIGQLNCKGFQRAIRLEKSLVSKFGKPDYIFAPNPFVKVTKSNGSFYYFRPLSTVTPLSISLGVPISIPFGQDQVNEMVGELLSEKYENSTIFVSWAHQSLVEIVNNLLIKVGNKDMQLDEWPKSEFDRLVILKLTRPEKTKVVAKMIFGAEGIDASKLPDTCP